MLVKDYHNKHQDLTFEEIEKVFPPKLQGSFGVVRTMDFINGKNYTGKRYFTEYDDIIISSDEKIFAVSRDWDKDNMPNIVEVAKKLGYNVEVQTNLTTRAKKAKAIQSKQAGKVWLLSSNQSRFDLQGCFDKYGEVFWHIKGNFSNVLVGDRGYIYSSSPDSCVKYSFEVTETDLPYSERMDRDDAFSSDGYGSNAKFGATGGQFALVKLTGNNSNEELSLARMMKHGLNGAPQGPMKLSQEKYQKLREYIEKNFGK